MVLVKNLPLTVMKVEVIVLFTQAGFDPTKFIIHQPVSLPGDQSHLGAMIKFEDPVDGRKAVVELDNIKFGLEGLKLTMASFPTGTRKSKEGNYSHILVVAWLTPSDTILASYSSLGKANSMETQL